jgi:hypothetical protein
MKYTTLLSILILLGGVVCFSSCSEEESNLIPNKVYINTQIYPVNILSTKVVEDKTVGISQIAGKNGIEIPIRTTMPAEGTLTVGATVNNDLIEDFNSKNGTRFVAIAPEHIVFEPQTCTIAAGEMNSKTSIGVKLIDINELSIEEGALIPVSIALVSGRGVVSENMSTVYIKIYPDHYSFHQTMNATVIHDEVFEVLTIDTGAEESLGFKVISKVAAPSDITAKAIIDESLIEAYNTEHQTNFQAMDKSKVRLSTSTCYIKKGELSSEQRIEVVLENCDDFTTEAPLLIPIRLEMSADGKTFDTTSNTVFIKVTSTTVNVSKVENIEGATSLDRTGWSITASGYSWNNDANSLLNGNYADGWISNAVTFELDMKDVKLIKGFGLGAYYAKYAQYVNADQVSIEVSTDHDSWNSIGSGNISSSTGGSATDPVIQYLQIKPINARYIKISLGKSSQGYCYCGLSELTVYE